MPSNPARAPLRCPESLATFFRHWPISGMASHTNKIINTQLSVTKKLLLVPPGYFQTFINMQKRNTARLTRLSSGGYAGKRNLRAAVCKYREFAVKTEILKFIFSQKNKPFGETFTIKVSKGFSFSRKPGKSETAAPRQ